MKSEPLQQECSFHFSISGACEEEWKVYLWWDFPVGSGLPTRGEATCTAGAETRPGEAQLHVNPFWETAKSTGQEEPSLWGCVWAAPQPQQPQDDAEPTGLSVGLAVPWTPGDRPMTIHCELGEQMNSVREG